MPDITKPDECRSWAREWINHGSGRSYLRSGLESLERFRRFGGPSGTTAQSIIECKGIVEDALREWELNHMDPNAAFDLLTAAIKNGDAEEAKEHAENLAEWVGRGGYLPDALNPEGAEKAADVS